MGNTQYSAGFETVTTEQAPVRLCVSGCIPSWLRGTLFSNGPACFETGGESVVSWLDGLAMLSSFAFDGGAPVFRNRFLITETYKEASKGRLRYAGFATGPVRGFCETLGDILRIRATDNVNVNIAVLNGQYTALTETPQSVCFDPETLETLGKFIFDDSLRCMMTTPHPVYCPEETVYYNVSAEFGITSRYHVYRMAAGSARREVVASLHTRKPCYMHSFAVSPRFVILCEAPFRAAATRLVPFLLRNRPLSDLYAWQPDQGVAFLLVDKHTGAVRRSTAKEAFFFFHMINAFEEDGEVVLDAAVYDSPKILNAFHLARLRSVQNVLPGACLRRFRIPAPGQNTQARTIASETLCREAHEFPRINPVYYGRGDYSYVYGCGLASPSSDGFYNQLIKMNLHSGTTAFWREDGCYPGEPVFTPQPGGQQEDEGIVLSLVLDTRAMASFLLALDGGTFREVARMYAPLRIPFGFHSQFYAAG